MPVKQTIIQNVSEIPGQVLETAGSTGKKIVNDTSSQILGTQGTKTGSEPLTPEQKNANKQEVEGLYGGRESLMDSKKYSEKTSQEKTHREGLIQQILGELLGKKPNLTPEQKRRMTMEHKQDAENLSSPKDNNQQRSEEQQKKQAEEKEEKEKKAKKEREMSETVGVEGKTTGTGFARKKSAPRMQQPPKTSENKAGNGIGG